MGCAGGLIWKVGLTLYSIRIYGFLDLIESIDIIEFFTVSRESWGGGAIAKVGNCSPHMHSNCFFFNSEFLLHLGIDWKIAGLSRGARGEGGLGARDA